MAVAFLVRRTVGKHRLIIGVNVRKVVLANSASETTPASFVSFLAFGIEEGITRRLKSALRCANDPESE